jgi:hypothetical protein
LNRNLWLLAMLAVFALVGSGCSGVNTSGSVSPLDFFLPGAGHLLKADPAPTNAPGVFPATTTGLVSIN